jgi:hypothetical protein
MFCRQSTSMSVVLLLSCLMSLLALSQGDRFKLGDTLANANLFGVCEQTTKTAALVQQLDVDCDGVRQSGKAIVLGVARLTCATGLVDGVCSNTVSPLNAYAYIVGVQMQFSAKSTVTCNTTVPWYLVPNGNVNCFSAERCYTQSGDPSSACKEIFLKGISVTLSSPTYMRTINPTGVEFPYTYVQLSREKMAGASASYNNPIPGDSPELRRIRTLQSQLMLATMMQTTITSVVCKTLNLNKVFVLVDVAVLILYKKTKASPTNEHTVVHKIFTNVVARITIKIVALWPVKVV